MKVYSWPKKIPQRLPFWLRAFFLGRSVCLPDYGQIQGAVRNPFSRGTLPYAGTRARLSRIDSDGKVARKRVSWATLGHSHRT